MCDSTVAFAIVAVLYLILFLNVFIKLIRLGWLERKPGKESLKRFLVVVFVFSAVRGSYLTSFPFLHDECADASQNSGDSLFWSIFGTLPSALFLTAFSVNITTLAKVYYTVTTANHFGLTINNAALSVLNLVTYAILISWYCLPDGDTRDTLMSAYLWLLSSAEFLIAVFLLVYASLLYLRMTIRPNPMARLFWASITCFLCFCVKSVLIIILALMFEGDYPPVAFVFYFIVSELIPLVVMLVIFETSGKRGGSTAATGKPMSQKFASKGTTEEPGSENPPSVGYRELQDPDPSINTT